MKIYLILMLLFSVGFIGVRAALVKSIATNFNFRTYVSFGAIMLIGFVVHSTLAFVVAAGIVLLITVNGRMDALCRLALLVVLVPHITYPMTVGGLYLGEFTPAETMTLATLIACIFRPSSLQSRGVGPELLLVLALMFIFGIIGARDATFTGLARELVTSTVAFLLPFFVFSRYLRNRAELAHIIAILGAASLILAVMAVYEAKFHWSLYDTVWRNQSSSFFMSHNVNIRAGFLRTPTAFREATSFAIFQMIGIFAVIASRPFFRNSMLWALSIALCVIGLLAAQSRGADLGLVVGLIAWMLIRRNFARAAVIGAFSGIVTLLLFFAASSLPRVAEFLGQDRNFGSDADYRQTLLRRGIQEGMKHPFVGQDMTRVAAQLRDITQGEGIVDFVNTPLIIFLSSGLVGLLTVTVLTVVIVKRVTKLQRDGSRRLLTDPMQAFVGSALISEWIALCFTSFWERNSFWMVILIAGARILSLPQNKVGGSRATLSGEPRNSVRSMRN